MLSRLKREQILGGVILLLPLIVFPGFRDEIRTPKALALVWFAGLYLSLVVGRRVSLPFGLFLAFATTSALFSGFGSFQMIELAGIAATLGAGILFVGLEDSQIRFFLKCAVWGAVLNAAYAYVQMLGKDFIFLYVKPEHMLTPTGFMGQQTLLGPYLASAIVVSLFLGDYALAIFMLGPLLATGSSFTMAAFISGLCLFSFHRFGGRRTLYLVASLVPLLIAWLMLYPEWLNPQGRFGVWNEILTRAMDHWFWGHGIGTYAFYAPTIQTHLSQVQNGIFREAHSDILQLFFDGGLVGVGLILWCAWLFLRAAVKTFHLPELAAASAVTLIFSIDSLGSFPYRLSPAGPISVWLAISVLTFNRLREE